MKESGYTDKFRLEVIKSGIITYKKQNDIDRAGVRPLHRPKGYQEEERRLQKEITRVAWYKPYDTVLFCPPTPGGTLAERLKEVATETKGTKIKIVERAGRSIGSMLPGLKENGICGRKDCFIHTTGGRGNCNKESVVYKGQCLTCRDRHNQEAVYIGESGRSTYVRGRQHLAAIADPRRHGENAFAKHIIEKHSNEHNLKFKMDIIDTFKRPLQRQIREGVEIYGAGADILLNSKLDHYKPAVKMMTFGDRLRES